jgi:hypothetical protein
MKERKKERKRSYRKLRNLMTGNAEKAKKIILTS